MARLRSRFWYWWAVFSLYMPMRGILKNTLFITIAIPLLAWAFRDTLMLIGLPMWYGLMLLAIYMKWRTQIKPNQIEIFREIELEEKYDFFYQRFTTKPKE